MGWRENLEAKRAGWAAERRCTRCGKQRDRPDRLTCATCRGESKRRDDQTYADRKRRGVCIQCGHRKPRRDRVQCRACARSESKYRHQQDYRERQRAARQRARTDVLMAYGGKCACCGEATPVFLDVDHINGDGGWQRKTVKPSSFYGWLKRQGYPKIGFQLLCRNCNFGKYRNKGTCPHRV